MAAASKTCATTIRRNLLAPGVKSLRTFLQSELTRLRQTPVLVISSEAGASSSSSKIKAVADSCQWVKFTLGQQFAVRTVPTTISSAVPTQDSLDQTLELMQRTGAASVVSVGSGAAMDLGKAVQAHLETGTNDDTNKTTPLLLVPTTYSGVLAAGASHSLFLDHEEETLVPLPQSHREILATTPHGAGTHATVVSTLEPHKYMEDLDARKLDELLYAVSAILLDAGLRKSTHPSLPILLQGTINVIAQRKNNETALETLIPSLMNLLYQSAGLLSYGLNSDGFDDEDNRSIPIALASSLIPTLFPETHPTSFMASLVPGICHYYSEQTQNTDHADPLINLLVEQLQEQFSGKSSSSGSMLPPPSLVPRDESLQGFSVPDMALSHIQSNQAVWKPLDVPDDVLVQVLQHSIKP